MRKSLPMLTCLFTVAVLNCSAFAQSGKKDIVDTAIEAGNFKTLVTALEASGLDKVLKRKGKFTVFAPTDAAFKKIPAAKLKSLLKPESKDQLTSILKFHVISGEKRAAAVKKLASAKTALGENVKITASGNQVFVGKAKVIKTDLICGNGVIHVVDSVIMPPSMKTKTDNRPPSKKGGQRATADSKKKDPAASEREPAKTKDKRGPATKKGDREPAKKGGARNAKKQGKSQPATDIRPGKNQGKKDPATKKDEGKKKG